jgi:hypothetical protein
MAQDFKEQFDHQVSFMESSAKAYDDGNEPEAKRLAVSLRVLLHDTKNSHSLLSHLRVKDQLPFTDSAAADPPQRPTVVFAFSGGLCIPRMHVQEGKGEATFEPPLGNMELRSLSRVHPDLCFEDWWNWPLLTDAEGNTFTRRDFVLAVVNKDGGAHVDAKLNAAYQALTRENSLGITQHVGSGEGGASAGISFGGPPDQDGGVPFGNSIALASIRQMTYEVLESLDGIEWDDDGDASVPDPICQYPYLQGSPTGLGRNDQCPCGSGRKFKKCFDLKKPRSPWPGG